MAEYTKMDTQGMGAPMSPEDLAKWKASDDYKRQTYKPAIMKILINEVLDEREGKMNYKTYFDTEPFKHPIDEEEPPYEGVQYPNLKG